MSNNNALARHSGRRLTLGKRCWYQFCRSCLWLGIKPCFRVRYQGKSNVPRHGSVLIVSNHQSFLDPVLVGCGMLRHMNYLARKSLFRFKPFGWLIDSVDAIPLDKEGIGYAGIKETLKRLKNREGVVIFPEGARCVDGRIAPLTSGYVTLAVRSNAVIVPAAVAGAFEVFPRDKKWPSFFKRGIRVGYATPLTPEEYKGMSDEQIHELVVQRIKALFEDLQRSRGKTDAI